MEGLTHKFCTGFNLRHQLKLALTSMPLTSTQTAVVEDYIAKKRRVGRLLGPLLPIGLHINRFKVIPKGCPPERWRLITDLSFPHGRSVNDGIE